MLPEGKALSGHFAVVQEMSLFLVFVFDCPGGLPASQTMVATQMTMERAVVPENRKVPDRQSLGVLSQVFPSLSFAGGGSGS